MNEYKYYDPQGYEGSGSDIKWCSRIRGRKKCNFCFKYANLEIWKKEWKWFYLLSWWNWTWFIRDYAHYKQYHRSWETPKTLPINYRSTGIKDFELRSVLNKGCKENKKCRCSTIVQRAFWYCPECYELIKSMAKIKGVHFHDIMLYNRDELKGEVLILKLSGSI